MSLSSIEIANLSRISTLKMIHTSKAAHIGSSLSVIDILSVLFGNVANVSQADPDSLSSDQVIVSKGHAAAGTYAVLSHAGFFSTSLLDEYCKDGAALGGHVTYGKVPGIPFSTGSLGHGLPLGIGLALARTRTFSDAFVFVVMSDGECDEGTTWESALIANQYRLGNLVALIDRNRQQSFGDTEETIALDPFDEKWRAFGWNVFEVDGHDHAQIAEALLKAKEKYDSKPTVVICNTTKGKGVSFMENEVVWHYRPPNEEQFNLALAELEALK
jgi:transketolase